MLFLFPGNPQLKRKTIPSFLYVTFPFTYLDSLIGFVSSILFQRNVSTSIRTYNSEIISSPVSSRAELLDPND